MRQRGTTGHDGPPVTDEPVALVVIDGLAASLPDGLGVSAWQSAFQPVDLDVVN